MTLMMFLPGDAGTDPNELQRRGLGDLLDPTANVIPTVIRNGPMGNGALWTFDGMGSPKEINRETQEWLEAPPDGELEKGRYWLGYVKGKKPTPEMLQRRDLIDGRPVVLADNKVWVIPICEYAPKRLTLDPNTGSEVAVVDAAHKYWVEWTNAIYELFVSDGFHLLVEKQQIVKIPNGLAYAGLTLSKNYRVNTVAVALLGLIGQYEAFEIARVATAMVIMEEVLLQKKSMVA